MPQFIEIKPYTPQEVEALRDDYFYAVNNLCCNVSFETYCGLRYLQELTTRIHEEND
jgi:hypothetical protein